MKSLYYQFVNYMQAMNGFWFACLWMFFVGAALLLIMRFYKIYNGTQTKFEKLSLLVLCLICFAIAAFLIYIRK